MNYETRIEECKQIALKALNEIEELKKELLKVEVGYPEDGTEYWFISSLGDLALARFKKDTRSCKHEYDTGNYFQTEQEAADELRYRIIDTKLVRFIKKLNDGWVPDWNIKQTIYAFGIKRNVIWCFGWYDWHKFTQKKYYLKSDTFTDEIIDHIGEEDLKWYLSR